MRPTSSADGARRRSRTRGFNQTGVKGVSYGGLTWGEPSVPPFGNYWLFALKNPRPDVPLRRLRLEAATLDWIAIGAITMVHWTLRARRP